MKIEIISGSPRVNSVTRRAALYLKNWLKQNTSHDVDIIELKDWVLPPVQTVFVSVDNTPEEFKPLAERIFNADAFILVTPEYNGSYSPALKNLLDHGTTDEKETGVDSDNRYGGPEDPVVMVLFGEAGVDNG